MEKYPSSRMANRYTRIFDAGGKGIFFCMCCRFLGGLVPGFVSWVLGAVSWDLGTVRWDLGIVSWVSGIVFWVSGLIL